MRILRTPDERFRNLPGFEFEPNIIQEDKGAELARLITDWSRTVGGDRP